MALRNDDGLLLSGSLFLRNRRIADAPFVEVGNVTSLQFEPESETKTRESRQKGTLGQILDSVVLSKGVSISWQFDTFNRENMAFALSGDSVTVTGAVTPVPEAEYTVAKLGAIVALPHSDIDPATLVVKNKRGEQLADGLFELNPTLGFLTIHPEADNGGTGAVKAGEKIKVAYSTKGNAGFEVLAQTVTDYDFEMRLNGYNHASDKECVLEVPSVKVAADGAIDWMSGEFAKTGAKGKVVTVNGNKYSYKYRELG